MYRNFPGTQIEISLATQLRKNTAREFLDNIFATGGLVMSQVTALTGIEYYMIQNWVKRGFVSPPHKKLYTKKQFCRIVIINMLKETMQIEKITKLLSHINGVLSDESDDLIDDSVLYNFYCNIAFFDNGNIAPEKLIDMELRNYSEPVPSAKAKLHKVLLVMYYAGCALRYKNKCEEIMFQLD